MAALIPAEASSAALTACGGGGGGTTPPPPALPTAVESSRFLAQASMGASRTQIVTVQSLGYYNTGQRDLGFVSGLVDARHGVIGPSSSGG